MGKRGVVNKSELKESEERPIRWRKYPHLFLIVCEDGNTEPYYFETFKKQIPEETIFLRAVGTGRSSIGVVEQAIIEKNKLAYEANKEVDEVWSVFDKDDADKEPANAKRFTDAFELAKENNIKIAYSNEVFELWLLLHFRSVSSAVPIPRADIYALIEAVIKSFPTHAQFIYDHGKSEVIDALIQLGNETAAIRRAKVLITAQNGKQPIDSNPNTTVIVLVEQLRALIEYYSYIPD